MAMGRGGQIFSDLLTGLLGLQSSTRRRCRGEANMTCRHLRHTCTYVFHHDRSNRSASPQSENISKRTSSGRTSIVIWSALHQSVVIVGVRQKTDTLP